MSLAYREILSVLECDLEFSLSLVAFGQSLGHPVYLDVEGDDDEQWHPE